MDDGTFMGTFFKQESLTGNLAYFLTWQLKQQQCL